MSRLARSFGRLLGALVALLTSWRALVSRQPPRRRPEVDPRERSVPANRRAETLVAALLLAAAVCALAFTVIYVVLSDNTQLLGLTMGLALALLAVPLPCVFDGSNTTSRTMAATIASVGP